MPPRKKIGKRRPANPATAALPDSEIPDLRQDLHSLLKGVGDVATLADKKETQIIPTIFTGLNRATRCGGLPVGRVITVSGPSGEGKTAFALGIALSFQRQGHFAHYVDAEGTLHKIWTIRDLGVNGEMLGYHIPLTYEETVKSIDKIIKNFTKMRDAMEINKSQALLIIVDSLTKLTPEKELEKLSEIGKGYPLRALFNTFWLDKLTPVLAKLPILFVILAHEKLMIDDQSPRKRYKTKGGDALFYDASMFFRIHTSKTLRKEIEGKRVEIGQLHDCMLEKNKLGIKREMFRFVMSNGKGGTPIGFDLAREVLEEAQLRGDNSPLIRKTGGVWHYDGFPEGKIKGDEIVVRFLSKNKLILNELIAELNEGSMGAVVAQEFYDEEVIDV